MVVINPNKKKMFWKKKDQFQLQKEGGMIELENLFEVPNNNRGRKLLGNGGFLVRRRNEREKSGSWRGWCCQTRDQIQSNNGRLDGIVLADG